VRSPTLITLWRTIRIYREAAGMIQKELAHKLGYANAWLSNVETAQLRPRQEQLTAIEEALKIPPGVLMGIHTQLDVESLPGYLRSWTEQEDRATVLRTFHVALVPDLLQTEDYARALLADDEPAVRARLSRQAIRIETPSRDIITNNREDIAGLLAAWEATRTFALSQRESIELIQTIAEERWT
jgi:transcriptional regulator with XRE-family HTH domain